MLYRQCLISYLTGRTQVVRCNGSSSLPASINTSIVQGSGSGPMLYAIMKSVFYTISLMNMLIKYADDTTFLVPSDSDVGLVDQFSHVKHSADENRMIISIIKTKEIVFRRPNPRLCINPVAIRKVTSANYLLEITLCDTL